jgi:cysteine-rich repeat protein
MRRRRAGLAERVGQAGAGVALGMAALALGPGAFGACIGPKELVPFPEPAGGCPDGTTLVESAGGVAGKQCWTCAALVALDASAYCDDGNLDDDDGCDSNCTPTGCGNGVTTAGISSPAEELDDGNSDPTDAWVNCQPAQCGDGFVWAGDEACDDGNEVPYDGCESNCLPFDNEWAQWPMPNSPGSGLPNEASYDVQTAGVVRDLVTQLVWQREAPDEFYDWEEAKEYCGALELGGWRDWRLPSRVELMSIVDLERDEPAIDDSVFQGPLSDFYWSSSPVAGDASDAWYVDFLYGSTSSYDVSNTNRVRCVR